MTVSAISDHPEFTSQRPLRLTRRGRLVLVGIPVLLALTGLLAVLMLWLGTMGNLAQAGSSSPTGPEAEQVTVSAGDTLWSLASETGVDGDLHGVVSQIAEMNSLESSEVEPGQRLYVPVQ